MLELSIALHDNERTRPILDGRVAPQGIKLIPTVVHGSEMFWRQLKFSDFDVSEMSMSSLLIATSQGDKRWAGIPVYTSRGFFHTGIQVRADRGIKVPADLKGKRVGVPEYQQTSALWSRGILQHEFGVKPVDIEWFMERTPDVSHGGVTGFKPPKGVKLRRIPPETNIGEMLLAGDLDATLLYLRDPNLVDRSRADISAAPSIRRLFKDPGAEARRYYAKTGIFPINHAMVARRGVLDRHPWVALNIYKAFVEAAALLARESEAYLQPFLQTGLLDGAARAGLKADPMPYGVKAARPVLETITRYVHEQGLTKRRVALDEVFAASTMDV